jgi:Tfp pilus assembly protein PilN
VSQVNLLPPEIRQRQAQRRTTTMIGLVGAGFIALLLLFYFIQIGRLGAAQDDLEAQESQNAQTQQQIDELQPFADLEQELADRQALVAQLYLNEVSWSSALLDISRVIPDPSVLSDMSGSLTATQTVPGVPAPTGVSGAAPSSLIGSMTFSGTAAGSETISQWLTRLEQVEGWVNPWVSSATENGERSRIYQFTSGVDLTIDAATERGRGGTTTP